MLEAGRRSSVQAAWIWRKLLHALLMLEGDMAKLREPSRVDKEKQPPFQMCNSTLLSDGGYVLPMIAAPREIPNQLGQHSLFLTYIDGEGSFASVGEAVWEQL